MLAQARAFFVGASLTPLSRLLSGFTRGNTVSLTLRATEARIAGMKKGLVASLRLAARVFIPIGFEQVLITTLALSSVIFWLFRFAGYKTLLFVRSTYKLAYNRVKYSLRYIGR